MDDRAPPRHRSVLPSIFDAASVSNETFADSGRVGSDTRSEAKQHDRKTHKMMSFRRPLKNQALGEKARKYLRSIGIKQRVMKDSTPFKMDAVLAPSSLMIPKQVRPSDPRDDSIFAMVYHDEDYLQVPLRPIKGLKVDNRYTQSVVNEDTHSLAQTHPPLRRICPIRNQGRRGN